MAANNRRDVELALRVSTLGAEGIRALENQVRSLAQQGGAAAPEFERLANEISRLGDASRELESFSQISKDVRELGAAQNVTAETAAVLFQELQQLATGTARFAEAERAAKDALRGAQAELNAQKDALRVLRIETDAADKSTASYQEQVRTARLEIVKSEQGVRALKDELGKAKDATKEAAAAEGELERKYRATTAEAERNARALEQRNQELIESRGTLAAAGVATDDLNAASARLLQSLNAAGTATRNLIDEEQRAIASAKEHANEEEYLAGLMKRTRAEMAAAAKAEADGIIRDFQRMEQAEREAKDEAIRMANALRTAFETVGGRSVKAVSDEIEKVRSALTLIKGTAGLTGAEVNRAFALGQQRIAGLERELRAASGQLTLMDRAAMGLKSTLGQFTAAFGLVEITQRLATGFLTANKQIEALRLGLGSIYKSSELAGSQIDFLRKTADRAGISVGEISQSFVKFAASTQAANIPIEQTNALFAAVTQAAGTLGLSGDKVSHMLDALAQMAAKGTVSMEELRQQLGDSLPGALSLVAKGMGLTEQQLIKLVESGNLAARDLFPALTKSLQSMAGEVDTLSGRWERFKNALTESAQTAGDAGWVDVLKGTLSALGVVVSAVVLPLNALFEIIFGIARAAGVLAGAIATATNPIQALTKLVDDATGRQQKLTEAFYGTTDSSKVATDAIKTTGAAADSTGQSIAAAVPQVNSNTSALTMNASAANTVTTSQQAAAVAVSEAAVKAEIAGKTWTQLSATYAETNKRNEKAIEVAEKVAKAAELQGQAIETITKLTDSEAVALDAATTATQLHLDALSSVSAKREDEVKALQLQLAALSEIAKQEGTTDTARKQQLETLRQLVATREAEAEKARQATEVAKNELAVRKLAEQTYRDNSASLELLRNAMELTKQTMRDYQALERDGFATKEQVTNATRAAAAAEGLYRDALRDSAAATERSIQVLQAKNSVTKAALSLDQERANSLATLGKETGNETLATYANVKSKELEVKARNASADALSKEAALIIANVETQRAALKASGELTAAKEAELLRTQLGADAKRLEADRIKESTKAIEAEIRALREGTAERERAIGTIDRETDSLYKQLLVRNKIKDSGLTADGFTKNPDGSAAGTFTNNLPVDQAFALANGQKMTMEQATAAMQQAENAFRDMQAFVRNSPGSASTEYINSTTALYTAARSAFQKLQAENGYGGLLGSGKGATGLGGTAGAPLPPTGPGTRTPVPAPTPTSRTMTVNVNLGGVSRQVNVASQADADALGQLFKDLEAGQRTFQRAWR